MEIVKNHKIFISLFLGVLFASAINAADKIEISIVYPKEGSTVTAAASDSSFIFGQVSTPDAQLVINGEKCQVYQNGAFLAYIPIDPGDFTFHCAAFLDGDTAFVERSVFIPPLLKTTANDSLSIDEKYIFPNNDLELVQGDLFRVSFKGTPGCKASFTIDGVRKNIPMAEQNPPRDFYWGESVFGDKMTFLSDSVRGIYTGSYLIQPMDWRADRRIIFKLKNAAGDSVVKTAAGHLSIVDTSLPRVAELIPDLTVLRTGPARGYFYFLPGGVKLWISGKQGNYYRVRFSELEQGWVQQQSIRFLPAGTLPPHAVVQLVRTYDLGRKIRIKVFSGERVPFRIEQLTQPQALKIILFGISSDTDWIRHNFKDPLIREIRWKQISPDAYQLSIELNQKQQWGYNPFYDENDNFCIDIKKTPKISGWPHSPLDGISILLDPGHEPDTGAVGPTGFAEKDANLMLATVVGEKLRSKGAVVYYTRTGKQGISLGARVRLAKILDPDILLSLHHNGLPDGVNPFRNRGTSSYYYRQQSYKLAMLLQKHLLKKLKLNNYGLFFDNLAMCRPPQMPAVLIEPAFMIHPQEEMLIKSDKYRNECADAIVESIEQFLREAKK